MNHIVNYDMTKVYHISSPLSSIIDYGEFIQVLEIQKSSFFYTFSRELV